MTCHNPDDRWTLWGSNILSPPNTELMRERLKDGPLIIEHRHCGGGRLPDVLVFDEFSELKLYLVEEAKQGDSFWVWDFEAACRKDNALVMGKKPANEGRVPEGGSCSS